MQNIALFAITNLLVSSIPTDHPLKKPTPQTKQNPTKPKIPLPQISKQKQTKLPLNKTRPLENLAPAVPSILSI